MNKKSVCCCRIGAPYLRHRQPSYEGEVLKGNDRYEGFCMDLISEIAKLLNFTFEFELAPDGKYGNYDPKTKSWNGLIKELLDRVKRTSILWTNRYFLFYRKRT